MQRPPQRNDENKGEEIKSEKGRIFTREGHLNMYEGMGTCHYFGVIFSENCGIIGYQILKYVPNYGYPLKKQS